MSGLPGLRIIIPPFKPPTKNSAEDELHNVRRCVIGDYSEETFFRTADDDDNNNTSTTKDAICDNAFYLAALQAMVSTGICCSIGEYVIGGHHHSIRRLPTSPFHHLSGHGGGMYSPYIRRESGHSVSDVLNVYLMKKHGTNCASTAGTTTTSTTAASCLRKPSSIILMAGSTTSILFGSKILLDQTMFVPPSSTIKINSKTSLSYNLLSSAVAGGVVGIINSLMTYHRQKDILKAKYPSSVFVISAPSDRSILLPPKLVNCNTIGRHAVGATLYFATYDCISSWMKMGKQEHGFDYSSRFCEKSDSNCPTVFSIMVSGGLAGLVHSSVLHYQSQLGLLRVAPPAIRAIPIHAMIFYGYETMKEATRVTQ
jgi:hypothetical protein